MHSDCGREVEAMPYAKYSPEEVESRGERLYEQAIRAKVEKANKGQFVVIDIETGQYEMTRTTCRQQSVRLRNDPMRFSMGCESATPRHTRWAGTWPWKSDDHRQRPRARSD